MTTINYWFWCNEITDFLIDRAKLLAALTLQTFNTDQSNAYSAIRKYSTLLSRLWIEPDVRIQANTIAEHFANNKGFVQTIWRLQKLPKRPDVEVCIASNILCESASFIVLRVKIEYLITAVRCAINTLSSTDTNYLDLITDKTFRSVVQKK